MRFQQDDDPNNPYGRPWKMVIPVKEYAIACDYIVLTVTNNVNVAKLDLCRWIIEKVADGTITVE